MPIINIKTMKGVLTKEKKKELFQRMTDLMVEVEGNGNKKFARYVVIIIDEAEPENFCMAGRQATAVFVKDVTNK